MNTRNSNRQWCFHNPHNVNDLALSVENFSFREVEVPRPGPGEILVRSHFLSCDPMNHAWAAGLPELWARRLPPAFQRVITPGDPMRCAATGEVVLSNHPDFSVGDHVSGFLEAADFTVSGTIDLAGLPLHKIARDQSLESGLSTLGMTGLCAYFGMTDIGQPASGETVLVSGASGAIGHVAGQLAKKVGAHVVGIAGGATKAQVLRDDLNFDAVIDYKQPDISAQMERHCPDGVDVYFDNVGGALLDLVLLHINPAARLVICGNMTTYDGTATGLQNITMLAIQRATMGGVFFFDYGDRTEAAIADLTDDLRQGAIRELFDISEGFASYPAASMSQYGRGGLGKRMVSIAE